MKNRQVFLRDTATSIKKRYTDKLKAESIELLKIGVKI